MGGKEERIYELPVKPRRVVIGVTASESLRDRLVELKRVLGRSSYEGVISDLIELYEAASYITGEQRTDRIIKRMTMMLRDIYRMKEELERCKKNRGA